MMPTHFPFAQPSPSSHLGVVPSNDESLLWVIFWVIFIAVSAVDYYVVSHRRTPITVKSALRWTALWIGVAIGYAGLIFAFHPRNGHLGQDYLAGYLTEYSLSVDNLFVFILIFSLMGVKESAQPKLIKLGIYLSIVLRIVFIIFGIALVRRFAWLIYVFGALLLWTAWKMLASGSGEQVHPEKNLLYRLASKILPLHADDSDRPNLFTRYEGRLCITPLFLVFLVIGSTDLLFAIDSIPAIMGISQDPFVVITSNVFAVLGLNALFFALRGIMGLFKYLKHGVSVILFFIGAKMIGGAYHPVEVWFKDRPHVSLLVIVAVLALSIFASLVEERIARRKDAPPGSP